MSHFTPGPWNVVRSRDGAGWKGIAVQDAERLFIANMVMQPGTENEIANARLIAAAPELLEALRGVMKAFVGDRSATNLIGEGGEAADAARAAIAKAEGQ